MPTKNKTRGYLQYYDGQRNWGHQSVPGVYAWMPMPAPALLALERWLGEVNGTIENDDGWLLAKWDGSTATWTLDKKQAVVLSVDRAAVCMVDIYKTLKRRTVLTASYPNVRDELTAHPAPDHK